MQKRRRFKQSSSLSDRLRQIIEGLRLEAETAPESEQTELNRRLASAEQALRIEGWLTSKELRPPK